MPSQILPQIFRRFKPISSSPVLITNERLMNKLKFFALAILLTTGSAVSAQQGQRRTPEQRADKQTSWMENNLQLTREQSKKVYDILLYYAREQDYARSEAPGPQQKADKKGVRKGRDQELQEVLTPDQYSRYQAHVQQMKERNRERRSGIQGF